MKALLNLGEILPTAPIHVVMRRPKLFPYYEPGTDIDLLVMDMGKMIAHLSRYLPNYTRYVISSTHIQIDHWGSPGQLDLKFDLYSRHISNKMTDEILATRTTIDFGMDRTTFHVPDPEMDNLLKCYEYIENRKAKYINFAKYEPLLKPYLP